MICLLKKVLLDWINRLKGNSRSISGNSMSGPEQGSRRCLKEQAVVRVHLLRRLCCRRGWGFRGQFTRNYLLAKTIQRQMRTWQRTERTESDFCRCKTFGSVIGQFQGALVDHGQFRFRSACAVAAVVTLSLINLAITTTDVSSFKIEVPTTINRNKNRKCLGGL